MEVRFHSRVQADLDAVLSSYYGVSRQLGEDFFAEFQIGIRKMVENPQYFHFDRRGLRRCNLDRFPYHFLYHIRGAQIRVWVLRSEAEPATKPLVEQNRLQRTP